MIQFFRKRVLFLSPLLLALIWCPTLAATSIFINELHYDNAGADLNEGVEIFGPVGESISGWTLDFYNGTNGEIYRSLGLDGVFADQASGFGTLNFVVSGIQNGAPDGLALLDADQALVQFLSYEGVFTATNGVAAGQLSSDIGVAESANTPALQSLQLMGVGNLLSDFQWGSATSSFGSINATQRIDSPANTVPVPSSVALYLLGLILLGAAVSSGSPRLTA